MRPDRIILGTDSEHAEKKLRELYSPFNRNHDKIIVMDVRSAELTKYAANCMLATKISFMNEIANLAELLGADIEAVRHGIGSDSRIGYQFIYPGCGYGNARYPGRRRAVPGRPHAKPWRVLRRLALGGFPHRQSQATRCRLRSWAILAKALHRSGRRIEHHAPIKP